MTHKQWKTFNKDDVKIKFLLKHRKKLGKDVNFWLSLDKNNLQKAPIESSDTTKVEIDIKQIITNLGIDKLAHNFEILPDESESPLTLTETNYYNKPDSIRISETESFAFNSSCQNCEIKQMFDKAKTCETKTFFHVRSFMLANPHKRKEFCNRSTANKVYIFLFRWVQLHYSLNNPQNKTISSLMETCNICAPCTNDVHVFKCYLNNGPNQCTKQFDSQAQLLIHMVMRHRKFPLKIIYEVPKLSTITTICDSTWMAQSSKDCVNQKNFCNYRFHLGNWLRLNIKNCMNKIGIHSKHLDQLLNYLLEEQPFLYIVNDRLTIFRGLLKIIPYIEQYLKIEHVCEISDYAAIRMLSRTTIVCTSCSTVSRNVFALIEHSRRSKSILFYVNHSTRYCFF